VDPRRRGRALIDLHLTMTAERPMHVVVAGAGVAGLAGEAERIVFRPPPTSDHAKRDRSDLLVVPLAEREGGYAPAACRMSVPDSTSSCGA
jgi:hypothetical protein